MATPSKRQQGVSTLEALAAFLILSIGLLAFARLQTELRYGADVSRQRAEAVRMAQQDMETLRAYTSLTPSGTNVSYENSIANVAAQNVTQNNLNTVFTLTRTVSDTPDPRYRALEVRVDWTDRSNTAQQVRLNSIIAGLDPRVEGQLAAAGADPSVKKPLGRSPLIPPSAVDLGNNKSGFTPPGAGFFWVFDSNAATVLQKCTLASGSTLNATTYATLANTTACTSRPGYLLSGHIRFDLSSSPSGRLPASDACDFYDAASPGSGATRHVNTNKLDCQSVSNVTDLLNVTMSSGTGYSYTLNGVVQPGFECFDDFATSVRPNLVAVKYYCAIYVQNNGDAWSGRSLFTTTNSWSLTASGSRQFRNCRYTGDYDRSNNVEQWEHPYSYSNVTQTLTDQNFLIVSNEVTCPGSNAVGIGNTGLTINYQTCRHQPDPGSSTCVQ